jgi:multiple sugar transport system ATP-binding protein
MANVTLHQLTKSYPEKDGSEARVVKGIDLEVHDGEVLVLVGPSGCGKSTTLRMIAGLEVLSEGTIAIDGVVVNEVPPKERDIAMVFQNYALYPHMTVYENMAFGLKLRKVPSAEIDARVRETARLLGLDALLDRRPKALSGGQRQRVAVGRAIVRKPKVFLFDEPLSNLDAKMRVSMRAELSRLHARLRSTVIYVTHDQVEAMTMGDRICVMHDGEIQQVAAPLELYQRPANLFVAGFIGSPPMNFLKGTLAHDGDGLRFTTQGLSDSSVAFPLNGTLRDDATHDAGREVVLGIRPEDITETTAASAASLDATIDVVEPMGAETYLHLKTGNTTLVARVRPAGHHKPGHAFRVSLDLSKAHLFDALSQKRIGLAN